MDNEGHNKVFDLNLLIKNLPPQGAIAGIVFIIEKMLSFHRLNTLYEKIKKERSDLSFQKNVLNALNITYDLSVDEISKIPHKGPVLVVANHPFGMIEGVILASILKDVRDDVKIMANYLLAGFRELSDIFIYVDPYATNESVYTNYSRMKESVNWLKNGGMLVVFPSGDVSQFSFKERVVTDPEWSQTAAGLVRMSKTSVLPVYFNGSNSLLFQIAGLIHGRLKTLLLPRQLLNKSSRKIDFKIGRLISFDKLKSFDSAKEMTSYMRMRTYSLRNNYNPPKSFTRERKIFSEKEIEHTFEPVIEKCPTNVIAKEILTLPSEQILYQTNDYRVYFSEAKDIPNILKEIGRLREITFRLTGEGTGKATDLDRFDEHYYHLFLWNVKNEEIIGAYRLGLTDMILSRIGKEGLYTGTLFTFKPEFIDRISPAIELGRAFIEEKYQKSYSALLLLWKGIGMFVARNPKYKNLFGTVSINDNYHSMSKQLLVSFLKINNFMPDLSKLVKPRTPYKERN